MIKFLFCEKLKLRKEENFDYITVSLSSSQLTSLHWNSKGIRGSEINLKNGIKMVTINKNGTIARKRI